MVPAGVALVLLFGLVFATVLTGWAAGRQDRAERPELYDWAKEPDL